MLCYGTKYIYRTKNGHQYTFTIMHNLPVISYKASHKTSHKTVSFSSTDQIYYVPSKYEEDRSIGFEIPRGLVTKWSDSQETILTLLNNNLKNIIVQPDLETPLKITEVSSNKGWWEDCAPLDFLDKLMSGKFNLSQLASEIDNVIEQTIEFNRTTNIELIYNNYKIDIRKAKNTNLTL